MLVRAWAENSMRLKIQSWAPTSMLWNLAFGLSTKNNHTFKYPQRSPAQSSHAMISFVRSMMRQSCNGIVVLLQMTFSEHLEKHYSITMSTNQMASLVCFNNVVVVIVGQILEITRLPVETVIENLSTLAKNKITDVETELPINQDSEFYLNIDCVNKRSKCRIPQSKTEKKEQEEMKAMQKGRPQWKRGSFAFRRP